MSFWAEDDKPASKLNIKGSGALSDAEHLAILIGNTGHFDHLPAARTLLSECRQSLHDVSRLSVPEIMQISGINLYQATRIAAAFELGRRRNLSDIPSRDKIKSSKDAFEIFSSIIGDKPYEEFWVLMLNRANKIIRRQIISEGGISGTVVDPKKIFKLALDHRASSIILGHNHPSGMLTPSEADNKITKKLIEAGKLLEIAVLDHIIVGETGFYSFADEGCL
jgi:DNA repair protein RadC